MSDIIKELKTELETMKAEVIAAAGKNTDEKLTAINDAIEALKGKEDAVKAEEVAQLKADLQTTIKALDLLQTRVKATGNAQPAQPENFNTMLANELDTVKDGLAELAATKKGKVSFQMKAVADMTFANNFSTAGASVTFVKPGIIELPKRKVHLRALIPVGGMGAKSTFDYVKEVAGEGAIWTAAEGTTKPQFDLDLQEASVKAEWIAGFLRISRNMLDDVTGMTTFLQSRLPELLLRTEDQQILTGNGTSPNLSGIFQSGNSTAYSGSATIDVEQLVGAISQLEEADREANGILVNPANYYNMLLNKASGSGEYDLPGSLVAFQGGQLYIAGVPVYQSTAIAKDKFLVGDWALGANFITREPVRLEFFYEDGTNVRENKVTVRIEERVALPIYGDDYFIRGDFGSFSS